MNRFSLDQLGSLAHLCTNLCGQRDGIDWVAKLLSSAHSSGQEGGVNQGQTTGIENTGIDQSFKTEWEDIPGGSVLRTLLAMQDPQLGN